MTTDPSTGSFTFDSSLIPPGGGQIRNAGGLGATDINFVWGRTHWTTANADLGELRFSASGELLENGWIIGGFPLGIFGQLDSPASAVVDDIFVSSFVGIDYTNAGMEGVLVGRVVTNPAPAATLEPSSLLLLSTGAVVGWARRRKFSHSHTTSPRMPADASPDSSSASAT